MPKFCVLSSMPKLWADVFSTQRTQFEEKFIFLVFLIIVVGSQQMAIFKKKF